MRRSLLIGWGNAAPSHLNLYARLHREPPLALEPISVIPSATRGLVDRDSYAHALEPIATTLCREPDRPTLVHLFSDNGFVGWAALLAMLAREPTGERVIASVRGVILDSAPGLWAVKGKLDFARRFALGMTPAISRRAGLGFREQLPLVTPALALAFVAYQYVKPRESRSMIGAATRVEELSPRCPHLFLYGEADTLVLPADVRGWIARRRSAGLPTEAESFPSGRHVALYPNDPRRYRALVRDFAERVMKV